MTGNKKINLQQTRDQILEILRQSKVKITNERKEIIAILQESKFPLSPAEIFLRIKPELPKANLTTVYRNLELLEGMGLVNRLAFNKTNSSYELLTNVPHHHHIVCKNCGKVENLENVSEKFIGEIAKKTKFKVEDHNLEFFGLCENCQKEFKK